jgi:hypothetical protein
MFAVIYGADFYRVSAGCLGKTDENQLMTVLGYRIPKKKKERRNDSDAS